MANTESDATYCSEAEKEILSQRRRSKRLAQKLTPSFRSDGDPNSQRFEEIYQMLKSGTFCDNWSTHDWAALQFEVRFLKKSLKGVIKSRITLVDKKIKEHLKVPSAPLNSNILSDDAAEDISREPERSPNILAGMMTEALTELPPYQPENSVSIMEKVNETLRTVALTQANPLDLTKKSFEVPAQSVEIEKNLNGKENHPKETDIDSGKNLTIDLTEDCAGDKKRDQSRGSKAKVHTSKWLKYVELQQTPKNLNEKSDPTSPQKDKATSFKHSLIKLYKDNPIATSNTRNEIKKSTSTKTHPKPSDGHTTTTRSKEPTKPHKFRNTESVLRGDSKTAEIPQRNVQSERFTSISPMSFTDDLFPLDECADDGSSTSLPASLKQSFKKIFGTDSLNDVLGCEKVIYSLTERHVERLASSLKLKKDSLKRTIEQVLLDDNCVEVEDDRQSGSSVVECSQSPTQRLFPSQRSQISK